MTPGSEADPLRELLHHMTARYLTVRSGGFEFEGKRALQPALVAELLGYGSARSLYRGRRPVCRSLDGIRAIEDPDKNCGSCLDRKHCTPQVRLDILVVTHPTGSSWPTPRPATSSSSSGGSVPERRSIGCALRSES